MKIHILNIFIVVMRVLTIIPLLGFLWKQSANHSGDENLKAVRFATLTLVWANALQLFALLFTRMHIILGYDVDDLVTDIIISIVSFVVFVTVAYAVYVYKKVIK